MSDVVGAELAGGWYLVVSNDEGLAFTDDEIVSSLSALGEVITCFVEEHVMCSFAAAWKGGVRVWSILHDSSEGLNHLDTQGDLPPGFPAIRDELVAKQTTGDCDYIFDVPVEVARSLVGYRHDRDIPGQTGEVFEILAPALA